MANGWRSEGASRGPSQAVKKRRRILISIALLLCVLFLISSNSFWRLMYPIAYQTQIQESAQHAEVDPLLIASIIRVESKFDKRDVSNMGAVGLMQLMPSTAAWIASKIQARHPEILQDTALTNGSLDNPKVNITLGCWYVAYLIERFRGNRVAAVAAYNGGPRRVEDWLKSGVWNGQLATINDIPVGETRHFVDRVFYNYKLYHRIYGNSRDWKDNLHSPHDITN